MRIAAVHLPELRVEVVRAAAEPSARPGPLAIVVAPAPLTEQKLLGNTRIDVVSREARARGVRAGQTIAQARARAGDLAVRVVRPEAVEGVLTRLAEVALAFGATVSFSSEAGDVVWVDVTGCAHLHGGEAILASRLARVIGGFGHACTVAIAEGPRVAAILARAASANVTSEDAQMVVVPPGQNAVALAPLSVSVLPLPAEDVRWLTKIGVRTIAELRALPRAALATRLGALAPLVIGLAEGEDRAPLASYTPPEVPEEEAALEYGIEGSEALTFVAKALCDRLASRLAGRAVAAARVELDLLLDAALLEGGDRERRTQIALDLPAPLSSAGDLLAALRPKIERLALRAPVLVAKLRAASLVHKPQAVLSLFEAQPKAEAALPRLVAELASDLGEEAVGQLSLGDAWSPEDRSRFVRLPSSRSSRAPEKKRHHLLSSVPEPTRLLREPVVVPRDEVKIVRHLARVEGVDWWKRAPSERAGRLRRSDYVYAWTFGGPAWVELDRDGGAAYVRGWFD
ncbi:MAG: DNA polymerase Y family protein [Labilithrix sp.]|nr:DNA polymerase Y family protein [Labilithrix sp.]